MSSKEFAQSFFPSASAFISSSIHAPYFLFNAWNSIFPDDVATLCGLPPQNTYYVHRPCLAIAALIGITFLRAGRRKESSTSPSNKKKKLSPGLSPIHKLLFSSLNSSWSISQKAFAKMNIAALIHHCIIPPPSSYHNTYRIRRYIDTTLRALDQIFTCISCIHMTVVAFIMYYLYHTLKHNHEEDNKKGKDVNITATRSIYRMKSILIEYLSAVIPISAVLLQYTINDGMMNDNIRLWSVAVVGTMIEMMYLIPLQIAAMCLLPLAIVIVVCSFRVSNNNKSNKEESVGAFITLLGGCIVAASLPLDSRLCHFISKHVPSLKESVLLYDIYQLPTWVFFGCDISFIGLSIWIKALTERCYEYTQKQQKRAKVTATRASF